jgi:hypothetical protein
MVVERFTQRPEPVYRRAAAQGRMPDGVRHVDSWIVDDGRLDTCFQLKGADDPGLLEQWISRGSGLGACEAHHVIDSPGAAGRVRVERGG